MQHMCLYWLFGFCSAIGVVFKDRLFGKRDIILVNRVSYKIGITLSWSEMFQKIFKVRWTRLKRVNASKCWIMCMKVRKNIKVISNFHQNARSSCRLCILKKDLPSIVQQNWVCQSYNRINVRVNEQFSLYALQSYISLKIQLPWESGNWMRPETHCAKCDEEQKVSDYFTL